MVTRREMLAAKYEQQAKEAAEKAESERLPTFDEWLEEEVEDTE